MNFQRLLEVETGYTKNEPVQLAMKDAIEKAVEALIIEGIQDKLWSTKSGEAVNKELVSNYLQEKKEEESRLLYDRAQIENNTTNSLSITANAPTLRGDYSKKKLGYGFSLGYLRSLSKNLSLQLQGSYAHMETGNSFEKDFLDLALNAQYLMLPYDDISPYAFLGFGYLFDLDGSGNGIPKADPAPKVQVGAGVIFKVSQRIDIKVFAESDFSFSDKLDLIESGKRDDYYFNFGAGINFHLGKPKTEETIIKQLETKQ